MGHLLLKKTIFCFNRLRDKNAAQLSVPATDPVVVRKIQIKLTNLISQRPPDKTQTLMDGELLCYPNFFSPPDDTTNILQKVLNKTHDYQLMICSFPDVIEETTMYLAVGLLQPRKKYYFRWKVSSLAFVISCFTVLMKNTFMF